LLLLLRLLRLLLLLVQFVFVIWVLHHLAGCSADKVFSSSNNLQVITELVFYMWSSIRTSSLDSSSLLLLLLLLLLLHQFVVFCLFVWNWVWTSNYVKEIQCSLKAVWFFVFFWNFFLCSLKWWSSIGRCRKKWLASRGRFSHFVLHFPKIHVRWHCCNQNHGDGVFHEFAIKLLFKSMLLCVVLLVECHFNLKITFWSYELLSKRLFNV